MPKEWQRAVEKCHCRCDEEGIDVNAVLSLLKIRKSSRNHR